MTIEAGNRIRFTVAKETWPYVTNVEGTVTRCYAYGRDEKFMVELDEPYRGLKELLVPMENVIDNAS
jgi:C4-type Zn-finger protein